LKRERDEALEREKATAEVLRIINSSAGDLEPIFDAMVENALRLCRAEFGNFFLYDGENFATAALHGAPPAYAEARRHGGVVRHPHPDVPLNRVVRSKGVIHIADVRNEQSYIDRDPRFSELVDIAGARTLLLVPMLKDDKLVGAFAINVQLSLGAVVEPQDATDDVAGLVLQIDRHTIQAQPRQRTARE
jgi:two-component system, NtrC family, sensor kinase